MIVLSFSRRKNARRRVGPRRSLGVSLTRLAGLLVLVALTGCDGLFTDLEDLGVTANPYDVSEDVLISDMVAAGVFVDPAIEQYAANASAGTRRSDVRSVDSGDLPPAGDPVLTSLEDLRLFPALDNLTLRGSGIFQADGSVNLDLSPLGALSRLEYLELANQNINDSSLAELPVSSWGNLSNLVLHDNNITDMNAVATLVGRVSAARGGDRFGIRLDGNTISPASMSAVAGFADRIWGMSIPGQSFTDLEWIPEGTDWGFLDISSNSNITDASGLQHFVLMDNLYIGGTTDPVYLEAVSLPQMRFFGANDLPAGTFDPQDIVDAGWTELYSISFGPDPTLTDISPLFSLTSIGQLAANNLNITSIAGISALTQLEELDLSDNPGLAVAVDEIAAIPAGTLRRIELRNIGLIDSDPQIQAVIDQHDAFAEITLPSGAVQ